MAHGARVWDVLVISEAQAASAAEQSMAMLGLVEKAVGVAVCELAKEGVTKSSFTTACPSRVVEKLVARASVAAEIFGVDSTELHVQISPLLVDLMPWCGITDCSFQGVPVLQQLEDCRAAQHKTCAVIERCIALFNKTEEAYTEHFGRGAKWESEPCVGCQGDWRRAPMMAAASSEPVVALAAEPNGATGVKVPM
ncbi:hypothetical protein BDR26DRAFT_860570 [Obelidium mucronatum]|nr:hypothetical protein BDR26DRAFT_860570 [Obelidium mucronatum]